MSNDDEDFETRKARRMKAESSFHYGKMEDQDRSFDIAYWQSRSTAERLTAAWELVEYYLTRSGRIGELRLQKSVVDFPKRK